MSAEADVDDRRLREAQLEHRPDEEVAVLDREQRAVAVDDPRRVGDRVLREEDVVERAGAHPGGQGVDVGAVVEADHPAEAGPEDAEGDVDVELAEHEQQQRPTLAAVRPLRREQSDRLDRERQELELECAGVLAPLGVDEQVPAALDHAGVEDEADALRRRERDEVGRPIVVGRLELVQVERHADAVDGRRERAELEREPAAQLERQRRLELQLELEELDREDAEERRRHGQVDLDARAALEADAVGGVGEHGDLERDLDVAAGELAQEAVGLARGR